MIVAELRAILDHLPDDLPIVLSAPRLANGHIDEVHRGTGEWSRLLLTARTWASAPEPPYRLRGPFRRRPLLDARLDGIVLGRLGVEWEANA